MTDNPGNPFNLLSIDFDPFSDVPETPDKIVSLSPSNDDLADIDWTQALFRGTSLREVGQTGIESLGEPIHRRDQNQYQHQQIQEQGQEQEQEQDLFAFALRDEEEEEEGSGPGLRHHSNGDITGDLDRDLGFQTGDEGF